MTIYEMGEYRLRIEDRNGYNPLVLIEWHNCETGQWSKVLQTDSSFVPVLQTLLHKARQATEKITK